MLIKNKKTRPIKVKGAVKMQKIKRQRLKEFDSVFKGYKQRKNEEYD